MLVTAVARRSLPTVGRLLAGRVATASMGSTPHCHANSDSWMHSVLLSIKHCCRSPSSTSTVPNASVLTTATSCKQPPSSPGVCNAQFWCVPAPPALWQCP